MKELTRLVALAVLSSVVIGAPAAFGAPAALRNRYALILSEPSVASHFTSRAELTSEAALHYREALLTTQAGVRQELAARNFRVIGSVATLVNAVFVAAPPERAAELKTIPGVLGVVPLRRSHPLLNAATAILDGPQAWALFGGISNAGAGIKIGVLDTGIDQTHPSLTDSSLSVPSGFPKCNAVSDCLNFTNSKVIVARSYVSLDATGSDPANPAADSQPDDYSARDRVGHGTAVATAAAGNTFLDTIGWFNPSSPNFNGMAPKAWLGSYKIAGSPGVNDAATDAAFIAALDDAVSDGMDVITTSFGATAFTGPTDSGSACGQPAGVPCDLLAYTFEQAGEKGAVIFAAAGNEGLGGPYGTGNYPAFNTINSPADAPSVIAVGSVSNAHGFNPAVEYSTGILSAAFTDAAVPYGAYTAPLIDISQGLDPSGLACDPLPSFSLAGKFALIERGTCTFAVKMTNAIAGNALGVVFYDNVDEALFNPSGLGSGFAQPILFIGLNDGQSLTSYIDSNPGAQVTIDPAASILPLSGSPVLDGYSSMGPGLGTNGIKPDVLAVGGGSNNGDLIFLGAQNYDPLGALFSSTHNIAAAGTSIAAPLAAGAAALVKQQHPGYTGQQIKSAIVNTAAQTITSDDGGFFFGTSNPVNILQTGGGLVATDLAIESNITIVPSTISFGSFPAGAPFAAGESLTVTNTGNTTVNLTVSASSPAITVATLGPASLSLAPGASGGIVVTLSPTVPSSGLYYGTITVSGGAVPLQVPWMYLSPFGLSGTVNLTAVSGDSNSAITGANLPDQQVAFQLTDQNGAPVAGAPVTFAPDDASAPITLSNVSSVTDSYGMAYATVTVGSGTGIYAVDATGGGQSYTFSGPVYAQPSVFTNGVVDNARYAQPIAPGSYVSIFGNNLSLVTDFNYDPNRLPLSVDNVTVSFDAPATGSLPAITVPGYLNFISLGQINIQIPWELAGYQTAQMKVTLFESDYGNVVSLPLAPVAPALFEITPGASATLDSNFSLVTATNPAARGTVIEVYCNGLGRVTNQPASGNVALATPLSQTINVPTVTIGGVDVTPAFSGLAPGYPGLNQINVIVPQGLAPGPQSLVITSAGASSQVSGIWVK